MKFSVYKKCVAIVSLYECGMMAKTIRQMLKPISVNERFVSRTLAHYQETADVVDQLREKHLRSVHTQRPTHAICEWIRWSPVCKQKRLAVNINVSKHSLVIFCKKTCTLVRTGAV